MAKGTHQFFAPNYPASKLRAKSVSNNVILSGGINWLLHSKESILTSNQQTLHCVQGDNTHLLDTLLENLYRLTKWQNTLVASIPFA